MMLAASQPCDEKRAVMESVALPSGAEPVQAEVEYLLSEDLKDLHDVDCHLQVSVLVKFSYAGVENLDEERVSGSILQYYILMI